MNPKQFVDDLRQSLKAFQGRGTDDEVIDALSHLYCDLLRMYDAERAKKSCGYDREKPAATVNTNGTPDNPSDL